MGYCSTNSRSSNSTKSCSNKIPTSAATAVPRPGITRTNATEHTDYSLIANEPRLTTDEGRFEITDITMLRKVTVSLLLREKDGRRRPTRTKVPVLKGELVEELYEVIPADQYSGEHNYRVYRNYEPSITLYCDATDVASLVDPEHLYLMAVPHEKRTSEFYTTKKRKEYIFGLKPDDKILFSIHSKTVRGRIRYLGLVSQVVEKKGMYFGVEIDKVNYNYH